MEPSGSVAAVIAIIREKPEHISSHETFAPTDRLAVAGRLLSSVVHELNNPLTSIIGYSDILTGMLPEGPQAEQLCKIRRSAQRASRLVQNLLNFVQPHKPQNSEISLNDVLSSVLDLVEGDIRGHDIRLVLNMEPGDTIPRIMGDFHRLQEVFLNLVTNALHAMKGSLQPNVLTLTTRRAGDRAEALVQDTGTGIQADILPHIFIPFFTTKSEGEGTGLGLSICREVIDDHGGTIRVDSIPGRGTVFTVSLAAAASGGSASPSLPQVPFAAITPQKILVVDDEPPIVNLLQIILEQDGHCVETAVVDNFFEHVLQGDVSIYLQAIRKAGAGLGKTPEAFAKIAHAFCAFQDVLLARLAKSRTSPKQYAAAGALHRLVLEIVFQTIGESFADTGAADRVMERQWDLLTRREREVASLLTHGLRNKGIAGKLGISVRTVEHHRARIREKLGIDSVAGLSASAALYAGAFRQRS